MQAHKSSSSFEVFVPGNLYFRFISPLQHLPRPGEPIIFLQLVAYTCSYIPDVDNRVIGRRLPLHNSPVLESLSSTKMDNEKNRNSFLMKCPYQYLEFLTRDFSDIAEVLSPVKPGLFLQKF